MLKSSLIDILKSFSKDELKQFDLLVRSPFYNKKSTVNKFWDEIKKYEPEFNSPELKKELIHEKLFKGKAFNYGTFKNLVFELTKLSEKFIELNIYNSRRVDKALNLSEGFLVRGLDSNFEKSLKSLNNNIENISGEKEYHNRKFLSEILKTNYLISSNRHYQMEKHLHSANEHLTMDYFIDVFNVNYNNVFMQNERGVKYKNDFIDNALKFYELNKSGMDFRVKLFYNSFMLEYKADFKYFAELRKILEANLDDISAELKYNFCMALLNYCSKKKFMEREKFIKTEFEIFRFMIENDILSVSSVKSIDGTFYKNAAYTALCADEIEWALEFIEEYKNLIAEESKENYYFHALIEYYIKLKNFDRVLNYLQRIKSTNVIDKLNIRKWEMLVNYELKNYETLRYIIDSSKHFVKNDKMMSREKKSSLTNFANFVFKLISISENSAGLIDYDISSMKNEIIISNTYYPEWLLEKISELEKSKN